MHKISNQAFNTNSVMLSPFSQKHEKKPPSLLRWLTRRYDLQMKNSILRLGILISITLLLSGCPRFSMVDIYNNSGSEIEVNAGIGAVKLPAGASKTLKFTSNKFTVTKGSVIWMYDRTLIPYGGENGPFFNGTIYVQLEPNGRVIATRSDIERPIVEVDEQPPGYPIEPNS